jgi:thioredoxin reductase (NADPH)
LIILGSGPAGLTAGLYAGRARVKTLILGENPGGNPVNYEHVGNYPGFPDGVSGAMLMMSMIRQVDVLGVDRVLKNALQVERTGEGFRVQTDEQEYTGRSLIIATGSSPVNLDVPGEKEYRGKGIYYCAHCDAPVFQALKKAKASVIGGGNSALHTALYVSRYAEEVTVIYKGTRLRAEQSIQDAASTNSRIRILLNREVEGVQGEEEQVRALQLKDKETGRKELFATDGIFVGIGMKPNSELFDGLLDLDEEGFIKVNGRLETSAPGIFAAGDVMVKTLRQIITAAGDGAIAADSAVKFLEGGGRVLKE